MRDRTLLRSIGRVGRQHRREVLCRICSGAEDLDERFPHDVNTSGAITVMLPSDAR